jgi:hypothetical protein
MMPTRARTRSQERVNRLNAERRLNRRSRELAEVHAAEAAAKDTHSPPSDPDEPPPF